MYEKYVFNLFFILRKFLTKKINKKDEQKQQ